MKRILLSGVTVFFSIFFYQTAAATVVRYELTDLGDNSFKYIYTIENDTLQVPVEQFTIWFDEQLYDNLQIATQLPLANDWDELVLPSTGFGIPLGYDALALTGGISVGNSASGFSVTFNWLGQGLPVSQPFEIFNPTNSQAIDSGYTIPEPATILFFAAGGLMYFQKKYGLTCS